MSTLTVIIVITAVLCALGDIKVPDLILKPLIVGGNQAVIEEAPFMALYMSEEINYFGLMTSTCGASILTENFVLSAAHCFVGTARIRYYVTVGTDIFGDGQNFDIENTIIHPNFNSTTGDCDVLVIKLAVKLQFSDKVQPIKLADSNLIINDGAYLQTFGFGITQFGSTSKYLRKVRIPYVSREKCKRAYKNNLTDTMMCAGESGKDSCQGDSGGPLVYGNVLVGVVSYGMDCGDGNYPGVYASVSKLRNFIDTVIMEHY